MDTSESRFDWDRARRRLEALSDALVQRSEASTEASREMLEERARRYATAPERTLLASEQIELLTFELDGERYAIESRFVREVLKAPDISPVPGAPALLVGVTNLRGEILAVMDLGKDLGCPESETRTQWVIVLGLDAPELGIASDAVLEVTTLRTDRVLTPTRASLDSQRSWIRGITSDALTILEGQAVLDDPLLHIDQPEMTYE